ncbi:MAG TPA: efflux RND transporter permease subunit, partial [Smithella sp.]|nr:efflux RND transporter permease subunit [Smithella sp.]
MTGIGISGKIARAFIKSKLTPLLVAAALLLGTFAVLVTPREEEPQIVVPMIDVFVNYPGASAKEVEERVTIPMEKLLSEIKGVEYVYSIVKPGFNMTIVRFYVGEDMEDSLVKLYNKLMSNYDKIPPGVSQPMVKAKSIDDVPVLALTLWSKSPQYTGYELRRVALELCGELKKNAHVSEFSIIGGQRRQVLVTLDPQRLRAYNLSAFQIMNALEKANIVVHSGKFSAGNTETVVETGRFLKDAQDVGNLVLHVFNGRPVYLKDVAKISDGPEEASNYVFMGMGPAAAQKGLSGDPAGQYEAVTIAIAKQKGANASIVA